jgi:hypothetical protein
MTVSKKQLEANKRNAQKAGVKTAEGKAIVKYNALKHGLLAKEVVITVGEGAENPEEFNALLEDLKTQLAPAGTLEEILVEKVAVAYWRLRRAYRYEVGLIRHELDTATDDFYSGETSLSDHRKYKTDEEIERELKQEKEHLKVWASDKKELTKMHESGRPLDKMYDWEGNWEWLYDKFSYLFASDEEPTWTPEKVKKHLNGKDWSDDRIWQAHIELCGERIKHHKQQIVSLEKQKMKNKLRLQVAKKLGNIPSRHELDRLFYKALNHLERIQRLRAGDDVPPPLEVDVDVNTGQNT